MAPKKNRKSNSNIGYDYDINILLQTFKDCLEQSIRTSKMPDAVISALTSNITVKRISDERGIVTINDTERDSLFGNQKANIALVYNNANHYRKSPIYFYGYYKTRHHKEAYRTRIRLDTARGRGSAYIESAIRTFQKIYPGVNFTWDK